MSDDASNEDDKVGYRRPPIQSRFKKGRSGNPRGRQKGVRNFPADVKHALETPVTINDKGKVKQVSTQEAVILRLREGALKGDARALECLLALAGAHNSADGDQAVAGPTAAEDQEFSPPTPSLSARARPSQSNRRQQLPLLPLPGRAPPLDRLLQAILCENLSFFIRKAFAAVSPGEAFLPNWHIEAIAHQLMRVHTGQTQRLLINQPPRSLKSICVSVAYVAWLLGHDPTRRVIVASYSGDFAAELHRQFRLVVSSGWYAELFTGTKWAKETGLQLVTTRSGGRYATSVGGTLTGRGGETIIIDDPLNASEAQSELARKRVIDWYGGTLVSRLNNKNTGAIIAVMQRLHEDDLAGHLLRQGGRDHLELPAIALEDQIVELGNRKTHLRQIGDVLHPEREGQAALDAIKRDVGSLMFSAQYQQRPVPVEGNLIRRAWFRYFGPAALPPLSYAIRIVQSWDIAMQTSEKTIIPFARPGASTSATSIFSTCFAAD